MVSAIISRRRFLQQVTTASLVLPALGQKSYSQIVKLAATSNSSGWTVFTPSADTQIIYVSSSAGNDRTGVVGDIKHPYKTLAAGRARLRNGKPDWLLLKKGDTWTDEHFGYIGLSGRSPIEPIVFGSYDPSQPGVVDPAIVGGSRPLIKTNPSISEVGIGGRYRSAFNFIAIIGLEFYAYTRDPNNPSYNAVTVGKGPHAAFIFYGAYNWILVENCKCSFYITPTVQGPISSTNTFRMRRCVITDSYSNSSHSQGLYIQDCANPYLEENLFDRNGWNAGVSGAGPNIFNRNVYIEQSCGPITAVGNMSFNSSAEGFQFRTGGTITDNLSALNSNGFDLGHQLDGDGAPAIHVSNVTNNVIMLAHDIPGTGPRGQGILMYQCASSGSGIHVNNNIIANLGAHSDGGSMGIGIDSLSTNCDVTNNIIFNWNASGNVGIVNRGKGNTVSPNVIDMIGANKQGPPEPFPDPTRTVDTYYGSIGGSPPTLAGFIAAASRQSKDNWNEALTAHAVNNYIRAGFGR